MNVPDRDISAEVERRLTIVETTLEFHVESCERRAARAEKLLWFVATTCVAVVGYLAKLAFHP